MFPTIRSVRAPEESARAYVYRILSFYIRELFLHPGEKLVETDVARALQVSRTPVHDTFSRLVREKMLRAAPRGALVPPLDPDAIIQLIWMYRTATVAVLGELYNKRPASYEALEECVSRQYEALHNGALLQLPRLFAEFTQALYALAGRTPVLDALRYTSTDLYRMLRMIEEPRIWRYLTDRHADLVAALALHDHEAAVKAVDDVYDLFRPVMELCKNRHPGFFEEM